MGMWGTSPVEKPRRQSVRPWALACVVVAAAYLALALGTALTRRPWSDEGWFASPALNLASKGFMGTTVLETAGTYLVRIERRTYWVMPLYLVTQAGWYKAFGFGLLSMRALSAFWGLVALASWFVVMWRLSGRAGVALLTSTLLAFDYIFLMAASFGRMEMMSAALAAAAYAAYLGLRESNLDRAVLFSQTLLVASGLTHHNAVLHLFGLTFLTLYFDRGSLRPRHFLLAAAPYLVGAAGWGLYVMQDPAAFASQFAGNAREGGRLAGFTAPFEALKAEVTKRYLVAFGMGPHAQGHSGPIQLKVVILISYVVSVLGALLTPGIRRRKGYRALLLLLLIYFLTMTLWDGQKLTYYLTHIIPLYTAVLAVWAHWCWETRLVPRWATALCLCALVALQAGGVLYRMRLNTYRNGYLPAARFLKERAGPDDLVMASAEFGFAFGFADNLVDDSRLGFYSGKRPAFVVVEEIYKESFEGSRATRPQVYAHVSNLLSRYEKVYDEAGYEIYAAR